LRIVEQALLGELHATRDRHYVPVTPRHRLKRALRSTLALRGYEVTRMVQETSDQRANRTIWPQDALTMIGRNNLAKIRTLLTDAFARGVPGDFIETGVWRGGASIYAKAVMTAHGESRRRVWVADSFAGLPAPDVERYPADSVSSFHENPELAVSLTEVQSAFERFGLLDEQVRFLKGWFKDTLPTLSEERWAVVRLDGDLYESTMDGLANLYPNLSPGGWIVIDDYPALDVCRMAVDDFRRENHITAEMIPTGGPSGVYWQHP
jgi:O-methyltransferase